MLRAHHPVGGQQGQRSPAGALAEEQADGRGVEQDEVGQRAGDLAGQPALLGLLGQGGARGVDDGEQRQLELVGELHAAPRLAQAGRAERGAGALP